MKKLLHLIIAMLAFVGMANAQIVYDFEDGTIPSTFSNDASYPWTVVSLISSTGNYCIQSGNGGVYNTSSTISLTQAFAEDGYIKFDANCMGEGTSYDVCEFVIDGVIQFYYGSNYPGWYTHGYNVAAGTHTFSWTYEKDGTVNPEGDYFQLDNIVVGLGSACVAPVIIEAYPEANKAYVEWNGVAESFTLRYKKGSGAWTTISGITDTEYLLENLPTGDFKVSVQADCAPGEWVDTDFWIYNPVTTNDWFGYASYSDNPAKTERFLNFNMQDITTLAPASEELDFAWPGTTFVNGEMWSVMEDYETGKRNLYKAPVDIYTKTIGTPVIVIEDFIVEIMAYNPVNGLMYFMDGNTLKSFDPSNPGPITSYGTAEDVYALAINKDGAAYVCRYNNETSEYELATLNLGNASMSKVCDLFYLNVMAFDMQTDELFAGSSSMYYIDHNNGRVHYLGEIGGDEYTEITCLFMVYDWDAVGESNVESLNVYPNPAQGQVTVEGTGLMVVSNLLGQEVLRQQIDGKATVELPKGIYLVRVNNAMSKVVVE